MHVIKDAVHGNISITDPELELLDTKDMQRLRGIKQVAVAYLVYPGANHTRFEHSLGTMHLTSKICENLSLGSEETASLRVAALLHDIGHTAFSHETEEIIIKHTRKNHEERGAEKIKKGEVKEILEKNDYPIGRLQEIFKGNGEGGIINFGLGSDRMDYLLRDSHYTGVAYGVIDSDRLIHTIKLRGGKAVIDWSGLEAAESLLIARFLMFSSVYYHHAVRIASAMLKRAIEIGLEEKIITLKNLLEYTDEEVAFVLKNCKACKELMERIEERRLFKRACEVGWAELNDEGKDVFSNSKEIKRLEEEVARKSRARSVIIDVPSTLDKFQSSDVSIIKNGNSFLLEDVSDIVKSIRTAEERRRKIIIACPKENLNKVSEACRKLISRFLLSSL